MGQYRNKRLSIIINLDNVARVKFDDDNFAVEFIYINRSANYTLDLTKEEYKELKEKSFNSSRRSS